MADFYTILRTAVGDSVGYDREARELLYRRAREALKAQLDSLETPISEEQKAVQMAQLDEAAERVEAEFAAAEAVPPEGETQEDADLPDAGPQGGETAGEEPPAPEATGAESLAGADAAADEGATADEGAAELGAPAQADAQGDDAPSDPAADGSPEEFRTDESHAEEALAGNTLPETESEATSARPRTTRRIAPPRRERKGGGGRWTLIILLLVILGGGGYVAWRWQDIAPSVTPAIEQAATTVQAMLGGEEEAAPSSVPDEEAAAGEKEPAGDPEPAAQEPAAPEPAEEAGGDLKGAVSPETENGDQAADSAGGEGAGREVLAEKEVEPAPAVQKDQDRVAPTVPAAERAYMIVEQGTTGGDDLRFAGSAQWGLEGSGTETIVTVTVQVPERSALIGFALRRNNDDSLPASHMIDVSYQGGEESDGPIINVPGFMVRVPESETPVPVRSAGALIMPGQYLLGLSGNEEDKAHNLSLLNNAQWFEVPAMFESRRRMVMVIEVGESGATALNAALAAWRGGDGAAAQGETTQ